MKLFRSGLLVLCLATPAFGDSPLVVEIVVAKLTTGTRVISQTGEIVARTTLRTSFPSGGRIAAVEVDEGDTVTKGMVLARVESVQQEQALRAAEAGVSTANADFEQAKDDSQRQQALLERGATTRTSRDAAEDSLRIAEGRLAQAKSELDRAKKAVSDTVVLAPTDATVTDRMIEPGQVVGAAQPVLELALGSELDAIFEISEDLMTAEEGASEIALISIDPPIIEFSGLVREISPLVDPQTGTVTVTVGVTDAPDGVTFGRAVRGSASWQDDPHVVLPYTAMSVTAGGPAVWVVDPDSMQVSLQTISVDRYDTGRIILSGGVDAGAMVVTKGAHLLYPGRVVRSVEDVK